MKTHIIKNLIFVGLLGFLLSSCQDKYFEDSGIHDAVYDGTVMDYIKNRPDVFDSLNTIIQLSGLESVLDQEGVTFFAPGDPSIRKALYELNENLFAIGRDTVLTLDQVDPSVWREYLSMYIYNDTYVLKDIPQLDTLNMNIFPGQGFISYGGQNMNIGVNYNDVISENSSGQKQVVKYAGYRQLFLSYILDISNVGSFGSIINAPVASSDIRTTNGVIHALEYRRHTFGFSSANFINSAYSKGIIYK
ncbi:fasciclin domain-containing protein [Sphingobacterium hungaricum]|nr:fasciclin domain-containing protein [Sphingobacterium hungaricum]